MHRQRNLEQFLFRHLESPQGLRNGIDHRADRLSIGRHPSVEQFEERGIFRTTAEFSRYGRSFRFDVTEMRFLSGERFYRRFVTVENLEQIENTHQAQSLYRKFRGLNQLD